MPSKAKTDFLQRYDWNQSYQWNYDHTPEPPALDVPPVTGQWTYCGQPVGSPLGIAAGPLLNGRWCLYYAALGFDVLTYKTVRSCFRASYPMPNLLPVDCGPLTGHETNLAAAFKPIGSWAVSFGMPSQSPELWQADIAETRRALPPQKILNVSVVGTMRPGWSIEQLADDYSACARKAVQAGADSIEFNLSCPNVSTRDGQLYHHPGDSSIVAERVRQAVGLRPLIAKIGHYRDFNNVGPLLESLAPHVDAVAATNCIAATVTDIQSQQCFNGEARGIAGAAILDASVRQIEAMASYIVRGSISLGIIGVGGISTVEDVRQYLNSGAEAVQLATAAMLNPRVGIGIRQAMSAVDYVPIAASRFPMDKQI